MKTQDKERIHFFLTKEEKQWLKEYCDKTGRTITSVMREYIRQLMKDNIEKESE